MRRAFYGEREITGRVCATMRGTSFGLAFKLTHGKVFLPEHLVHTVLDSSGRNESRSDVLRRLVADKLGGVDGVHSRVFDHQERSRIRFNRGELDYAIKMLK